MRKILYTLVLCTLFLSVVRAAGNTYAAHSALASGRWVKIRVDADGIYKLTDAQLREMGFPEPDKVSIHGYGGRPLSETFDGSHPDDLPAVSIYRGEGYLLFYGKGPVKWEYGTVNQQEAFVHTNNPYSVSGYYFVTDATATQEMKTLPAIEGATRRITTFDDYQVWEKEQVSVHTSGRDLFGESFQVQTSRDFEFEVPDMVNQEALITFRFIAKTTKRTSVSLSANGESVINTSISGPESGSATESYTAAREVIAVGKWKGAKSEKIKINITYGKQGDKNAHLDYIRLQTKRQLKQYGAATFFRSLEARNQASRFVVDNASASTLVWDITEGEQPQLVKGSLEGTTYSFSIPADNRLREFVAINPEQLKTTPAIEGEVKTQDLHGMEAADMVIIVPPAFQNEAERLAAFHQEKDGLTVHVINPEPIYNEFSSGTPDATAYRRLMKMWYDRSASTARKPKYLLLFGDGSYDNRGLTQAWKNQSALLKNMLLTYQSENSISMYSYTTDDYFGFLENDGETFHAPSAKQCLGIGRFPVRTMEQAKAAVDKVIHYTGDANRGEWKTNLCFLADDGSNSDQYTNTHMKQADDLTDIIQTNRPEFHINKLFFDAYKKDRTGGNATYPDVENALKKQLKKGLFLLNYTGHGGTESLSDEKVITKSDIIQSTYEHLPLWITATCDFTRFDDLTTSAGEEVFLNAKSGGIALFTTTRVVNSGPNFRLNQALIERLFAKDNQNKHLTLGDIMRETKIALRSDQNKLNFILVGDPALCLSYPEERITVTEINGKKVEELSEPVQLKALSKVTVKGEVRTAEGKRITDFNGLVNLSVLDSKVTLKTLDNNNTGKPFEYTDYPNTIYLGADSARSGNFTFSFTVPKDISYSNDAGKMIFYATDEKNNRDAQGAFEQFIVGGTSDEVGEDKQGPDVRYLYLNDTTFTDGGLVNPTPLFVACVWDKNGINMSGSGIGHDIVLTIDNNPFYSYILNDYYQVLPDSDGAGLIVFSIPDLPKGKHTAELKVWDVLNNSTTHSFSFEVVEDLKPELIELKAGPIPARDQIRFFLTHNRPETQLTITLQVFDMAGRLMWDHEETGSSDLFEDYIVTWDLTANGGTRLRPGVYLYRAFMRSGKSKEVTNAKKLIILAQ